jgi:uncharacterized membrane protein YdjX (TVP38/TMEM64 family)
VSANSFLESKGAGRDLWRPVMLVATVLAILVTARALGMGERLGALRDWIRGLGPWGPAVFILFYTAAVAAALPGSALTIAAGALFGSVVGVIVVSVASTLGASLSFLIARYFAREAVVHWISTKETFSRLDRLTEERGALIVALTRLAPIFPFNLLNYGFGLTRVPFWTYVFWSWLCMLPGTILYVVGTDALTKGISRERAPWELIGILAVTAVILAFLIRYARRRLQT